MTEGKPPETIDSRWAIRSMVLVLVWLLLAVVCAVASFVAAAYNVPLVLRIVEVGLLCLPILTFYGAFKSLQRAEPRVWLALIAFIIAIFQFVAALIVLNAPFHRMTL